MKQSEQIIDYLCSNRYATVRDLVVKLNINSPTKRVSELIKAGYPIKKSWVRRTNKNGQTKRFIMYHWMGEEL